MKMSKIIHINYFRDPHCFYFKFDDDLHDSELQRLEDQISKYAQNKVQHQTEPSTLQPGDYVAAYEISWGKWVRAIVRGDISKFNCLQLWAVDHGKLFRTANKNVVSLPQHLIDVEVKSVHRGSLFGISPANLVR